MSRIWICFLMFFIFVEVALACVSSFDIIKYRYLNLLSMNGNRMASEKLITLEAVTMGQTIFI